MKFDVALGTSVVLMAFDGEQLVALIGEKSQEPYKGAPMLPSNWVSAGESVEEVAKRMLNRILGVDKVYLEQLNAFAKVYRNPMGRVVNIAYFALLNWDLVKEVKNARVQMGFFSGSTGDDIRSQRNLRNGLRASKAPCKTPSYWFCNVAKAIHV